MFRKRNLCILFTCVLSIFFSLILYSAYSINYYTNLERVNFTPSDDYDIVIIEHRIRVKAANLPEEYKKQTKTLVGNDEIIQKFKQNILSHNTTITNFRRLWAKSDPQNINQEKEQVFDGNYSDIGNVLHALKTAKILTADTFSQGTQFKLLFQLEGNHLAVFKPQWYDKERIILGNVYAGKDRYQSEILAFYLAAILDMRLVPISGERIINVKKELLPVATNNLNMTLFEYKNKTCIYGKCFYCKREDPVCTNDQGTINGVILYYIPEKLVSYNSPWQRTYKKDKKAVWETQKNYCSSVKTKISHKRLLDLIDVAIFDFIMQNGDRHHYETLNDKVILLDNGKGLGNPYVHHIDILAPLYQCCVLRSSTWIRLKLFSAGKLSEILQSFPEVQKVVSSLHFRAIQERLELIYAAVELCRSRNKMLNNYFF